MALAYLLSPTFQVENSTGKPATGGWLEVFVSGSRDPYYCYSDFQGTLHPFKIPLDSLGSNVVLADDGHAYDVYVYNRYGGLLMSRYNVKPGHGAGGGGGTITSSDGSIDVTMTPTGYDLKVNGQEASALRAGANDLTSDGQFVFYELVRDGENVTVDTNGKIRLQEGWYHYDITARVKWEDGVTVDNTENHIQLYTTLNSDIIPFDCSYEHEDTLHLHGQVKIATSGSQFVVGVQGIESGMSIELVDCGMFAITGHGDNTEYTAGDGIVIDENNEISVDTTTIQEKLEAGDNIVIEGNVISATAEPQQQSDWTETDTSDVSYIKHKPTVKPVVAGANITITEGNDSFTISATAEPQEQANWNETDSSSVQYIQNKPDLSVYATGAELTAGLATKQDTISDLATIRSGAALGATSVQPSDLSTVATTGDYDDLSDKPDLSVYATGAELTSGLATKQDVISDLSDIRSGAALGETSVQPSDLATVATTGSYDDLTDKPVIPAAQVQADWDESDTTSKAYIQNKPDLSVYATDSELTAGLATKQDTISDLSDIRSGAALGETAVQPSDLSTVATTGDYDDLSDKPDLSVYATGAELTAGLATKQDTISDLATIRSGAAAGATAIQPSDLATVATTGDYDDLTDKPDLSIYAESSNLATVATTGSYDDLVDKPTIPSAQVNSDWNASSGVAEILNKPTLSTVATTGDYNDLSNKPSIPAAQINSDWSESDTTSKAYIQNKPDLSVYATGAELTAGLATKQDTISDLATIRSGAEAGATAVQPSDLATVATTGAYSDLSGTPTIPTATSDLTNDSGYITLSDVPAQVQADWTESDTSDPSYIANKPNLATVATTGAYSDLSGTPTINNVPAVTSNDDNKVLKASYTGGVGSYSWETETAGTVTDVTVDGSSVVSNGVAAITMPTVDQTYDSTSANAQSGVAMAGALSGKQDNMVVLDYGVSAWNDFITAYNKNAVVYCRYEVNSTQFRLAHLAYVNNSSDVTKKNAEFWFSRSIGTHTAEQQGDQIIVYKLQADGNVWTTATREIVLSAQAGDGITRTVTTAEGAGTIEWSVKPAANGGITVDANGVSVTNPIPAVTSSDDSKVLKASYTGGVGSYSWEAESGGTVTDVEVDGTSVVSGGVASITMPTELVPTVTSSDDGKVLKATYSGGAGSYSWETESGGGGTQVQSDWTESDNTDPSYIQNKPTVMGLTAGSNVTITEGVSSITIAATDTTYTAGTGISITNGAISNSDPLPSHTSTESGKVLGVDSNGGLGWVNQSGGGTTYTAGNMISLANSEIAVSTTAGITDIQQVSALPASPVATVLYLIPET